MNRFFIIVILILAFALRFWQLDRLPPGLTWDEAALGYNAYSIAKTARDEHGAFLPLIFKSFGDYKPGLYVYAAVPFVAFGGLSEVTTRLPSVIAGVLAVYLIYLLTNLLFLSKSGSLGLFTALTLALTPWHIHFSRGAWEVNLYTTLLLAGVYFLLRGREKPRAYLLAWLFFVLSLLTYQAAKLLSPVIFISLHFLLHLNPLAYLSQTSRLAKSLLLAGAALVLWVYFGAFFTSAGNRLAVQSLIGYRPGVSEEQRRLDDNNTLSLTAFHNQLELTSRLFLGRYFYHFSPEVLFYEGPIFTERGHLPRLGMLHLFEAVLIFLGLVYLSRQKGPAQAVIFSWLLLAPIPASLTLAEFSTVRALPLVIPLSLLSGLGLYFVFTRSRLALFLLAVFLINVVFSLDIYFFHTAGKIAQEFNYGYRQAVQAIKDHPARRIVFTDVLGQPYIYYLFYSTYDPRAYQKAKPFIDTGVDVGRVDRLDNLEFHQFAIGEIASSRDTLFIGSEGNIPNQITGQESFVEFYQAIDSPEGKPIFRVIKTKS